MIASRKALIVVAAFVLMALGLPWGGNVPAAQAQIQVLSANPDTGDQGTLGLNVTIGGKGFKKGAKAYFYLKGTTNPAGITVRATKFVSDASLVATIDIAAGATPDDFDIVVANADGRTGKGTELFAVLVKIDPCTLPDPVPSFSPFISGPPGVPGYLDSTFGDAGRVIDHRYVWRTVTYGGPVAIDSAGRTVFVGTRHDVCATNPQDEWAIVRYLPDGSRDTQFGSDGIVTMTVGAGSPAPARAVVVQTDDKILVAGSAQPGKSSSSQAMVVRLNVDGSLDTTFGTGGIGWVSPFGSKVTGSFELLTLQSDGKIVAVGLAGSVKLVSRLKTNGTLDMTFSGTGYCFWNAEGGFRGVTTQRVGSDERIVVVGATPDSLHHNVGTIWRFTGEGALDTDFGGTGVVRTSFHVEDGRSMGDSFRNVATDSTTRIVAVGGMSYYLVPGDLSTAQSQVVLARYDVNGNPDTSFGLDGSGRVWAPLSPSGNDVATAVAVHDGRIVVAGNKRTPEYVGTLWRFNPDGAIDTTFGDGGSITDANARSEYWHGMALQADGRIICGGMVTMAGTPQISYVVLARYWQ